MESTFVHLNQPPQGTDEIVASIELRKSYLTYLNCLFSTDLDPIYTKEGKL